MPINIGYLELRYSGGAANGNPSASLGGDMSSERVQSQSATPLYDSITGVTIEYAAGNALGVGTLAFDFSSLTLTWDPFNGTPGTPVDISDGGKFAIFGSAGFLAVDVVTSSLPIADEVDNVIIAAVVNDVWDDVSKAESFAGDTEYRAFYFINTHASEPFLGVTGFIPTQPTPGLVYLGADPAGVGDGVTRAVTSITRAGAVATVTTAAPHGYATGHSVRIAGAAQAEYNGVQTPITVTGASTFTFAVSGTPATPATGTITAARGVATTIADENTAPAGVAFTNPSAESPDGISLGRLEPGEAVAFWERRIIPTRNTTANDASATFTQFQSYF